MARLGFYVIGRVESSGALYLRPHHIARRESFDRACVSPHLDAAFIFPTAAHARIALEEVRERAPWALELEVIELAAAPLDEPTHYAGRKRSELERSAERDALEIMLEHGRASRVARGESILDDGSIVRVDGDRSTDGTWGAWKRANAEGLDPSTLVAIELELVRVGRYDEPAGASAAWSLELVRKIEIGVIVGCPVCGGGTAKKRNATCPVCDPNEEG